MGFMVLVECHLFVESVEKAIHALFYCINPHQCESIFIEIFIMVPIIGRHPVKLELCRVLVYIQRILIRDRPFPDFPDFMDFVDFPDFPDSPDSPDFCAKVALNGW